MSLFEETLEFGLAILMDLIDSMFVMRAMRTSRRSNFLSMIFSDFYSSNTIVRVRWMVLSIFNVS